MKKCPYCAEEIQEKASKCRYCQSDLLKHLRENISKIDKKESSDSRIGRSIFIGVFLSIVLVIVVANFTNDDIPYESIDFSEKAKEMLAQNSAESTIPDKYEMYAQGKRFVLQGLKSPSTAKFPPLAFEVTDLGNMRYKVISYVDSQNGFGATIRSNWSVVMKISGNQWILERMIIGGEVIYDPVEQAKSQAKFNSEMEKIDELIEETKRLQNLYD